jgi:hypothetical protein
VQSPWNPLTEDYTEIYYMIDEGDIPSIQCKMSLRGPKSMKKVDGLILIFIDFYVPALTQRLNRTGTTLQVSENITPFAVLSHIYRCRQQKVIDRYQVFGGYHLYVYIYIYIYILYNVGDRTEP